MPDRILLIAARSQQAKGLVERLFLTVQDRVSKQMRLVKVATIEAANQFPGGVSAS